jgi:dTDP-glucose 4,6-dehydratase
MKLNGKTVLVTGADGFIGSHVVEALVRLGCGVRALVLYNSFDSWGWLDSVASDVKGHFEVLLGDVRDAHGMHLAMSGCDIVMHLAALIAIPYSYRAPGAYIETNVQGTLNVVQAARDLDVERVVITSTSEVYGTARFVPITEDHPLNGQSPYAASKIGADALALSYYMSFGTPITVLRPFNTYGPRQSSRAVIPTVIGQIAAGVRAVKLGALSPTRDFTFVEDTAKGFVAAAACDAIIGQVANIGSDFEISVGDTVQLIAEIMKKTVEVETDKTRLRPSGSEVERLWAGVDKAKRLMDWQPEHGGREGFRRGLEQTVAWFNDSENLALYKTDHYVI